MTFYDLLGGQVINSFFIPDQSESEGDKNKFLRVHDMAFSMDEKEFSCVAKKYILIYSFDKLCEKMAKDIYADSRNDEMNRIISNK